jgi:hypothetical protein
MKRKSVICKSGLMGWQGKLQDQYKDFTEFESFCRIYNNHIQLGYKTPASAWRANPTIQGSTNPSDYRKVEKTYHCQNEECGEQVSKTTWYKYQGLCPECFSFTD